MDLTHLIHRDIDHRIFVPDLEIELGMWLQPSVLQNEETETQRSSGIWSSSTLVCSSAHWSHLGSLQGWEMQVFLH